jgi:hypothetical protein
MAEEAVKNSKLTTATNFPISSVAKRWQSRYRILIFSLSVPRTIAAGFSRKPERRSAC